MLEKRSLALSGHRTSLALEAVFWDALRGVAADEDKSMAKVIADIDEDRSNSPIKTGLASAVRVWLFKRYANIN